MHEDIELATCAAPGLLEEWMLCIPGLLISPSLPSPMSPADWLGCRPNNNTIAPINIHVLANENKYCT